MGKSSKKPRHNKMNPQQNDVSSKPAKKEKDWSFEDIARSKTKRR